MQKLLRGCLTLLVSLLAVIGLAGTAIFFLTRTQIHSTSVSPDGRFKVVLQTVPPLIAMPGQGSDAAGTAYLYDASGQELARAPFEMVQLVKINWSETQVQLGVANWDLPKTQDPFILLFHAAMRGDSARFKQLLPAVDPQLKTPNQRTLLHAAAAGGNPEIIKALLENNLAVNAKDDKGNTPLLIAVQNSKIAAAQVLLKQAADANIQSQTDQTPLLIALKSGNVALAQLLLDHNAHAKGSDQYGNSTLHLAAKLGNLDLLRKLLDRGADVNAGQPSQVTPLVAALEQQTSLSQKQQAIELLLAKGASLQVPVLHRALLQGDIAMVDYLIRKGAAVNYRDAAGATPLITLLKSTSLPMEKRRALTKHLLAAGADLNATDSSGDSPLLAALLRYRLKDFTFIEFLLQQGANVNAADQYQTTPLMLAAQMPYPEVSTKARMQLLDLLIRWGAQVDAKNQRGETASDLAVDSVIREHLQAAN